MKALVLYGPGEYRIDPDWPMPDVKAGWVRIRVRYAAICGSDLPRFTTTGSYHHPMILGHEFAGEVERPATGSSRFKGGERVAVLPIIPCGNCPGCVLGEPFHCENYQFLGSRNDGGFAEYCVAPETNLFRLPDEISMRAGAMIEPAAVALHAVRRSGFVPGQSALVFGAGAIGLLIGLWLKIFGGRQVAMVDLRDENLELARSMGFKDVYNPESVAAGLSGLFDHTFEAAGSNAALLEAVERTETKGTLTVVGRDTVDTRIPLGSFEKLMRREMSLRGSWGYNLRGDSDFLQESLLPGRLDPDRLISSEVALDDAPQTIKRMADGAFWHSRVVVKI